MCAIISVQCFLLSLWLLRANQYILRPLCSNNISLRLLPHLSSPVSVSKLFLIAEHYI